MQGWVTSLPWGTLSIWACTSVGVIFFWVKVSEEVTKAYGLSPLLGMFLDGGKLAVAEFLVFVALGTIAAVLLADPATGRQAFAAGLGWTALLVRRPA